MRFTSFVAALGLGLGSMAKVKLEHPSQSVVLIYPTAPVNVHAMPFNLGYDLGSVTVGEVEGLQTNVSLSLTYPNGTHVELSLGFNSLGDCTVYPGGSSETMNVTDLGT
jgi:hypothetical protein